MRILHTSDWHIGRTFHGCSTVESLRVVLGALVDVVRDRRVDVVVVSGDIFDSATPAAENYTVLTDTLRNLRTAGAEVVIISGNHDSATRLGFQSDFAGLAGIHVLTRYGQHNRPVTLSDEFGPVHFYGIPFLEPSLVRHLAPDAPMGTHTQVLEFVMERVRADLAERGGRSVVLAHCFAAGLGASDGTGAGDGASAADGRGAAGEDSTAGGAGASGVAAALPVERDITAGGLDVVPVSTFDGPDYVALGHIHGRATLTPRVRYSGSPLHYSFSEAGKPRGVWIVDLGLESTGEPADGGVRTTTGNTGLPSVEWVGLPVPRRMSVLTGEIEQLLTDGAYSGHEDDWVSAILTDRVRPLDGMRRLQKRFLHCVCLEHRPAVSAMAVTTSYAQRVKARSDGEIVGGFLEYVRNGVGPSEFERDLINELIRDRTAKESAV
jgi:exonuclease SbcD